MSIIKNYGLRWVRNKVEWGSRGKGKEGKLNGRKASEKSGSIIDFREQIGIYVLYEPNYIPVYIGQAGNGNARLYNRLNTHQVNHLRDRWTHFSWFGFSEIEDDETLATSPGNISLTFPEALGEIEGILIQVLEPRLNKQGPKWQQTATEYVQWGYEDDDPHAIPKLLSMIETLTEKVEALRKT